MCNYSIPDNEIKEIIQFTKNLSQEDCQKIENNLDMVFSRAKSEEETFGEYYVSMIFKNTNLSLSILKEKKDKEQVFDIIDLIRFSIIHLR